MLDGPEGAVAVEINEVSEDGLTVQRTYAQLEGGPPVIDTDDIEVHDQTKGIWDLWTEDEDGRMKLVDQLEEFWPAFELEDEAGDDLFREVCHILELPVWEAAPEQLKAEVYAWLRDVTQGS